MSIEIQNNVQILKDISEMILSKGDTENTINKILSLLNSKIKSLFLLYFLIDPKTSEIVLGSFTDERLKFVKHLIHFDLFKIRYPKSAETLISKCVNENIITQSNQLKDFFYPIFKYGKILDQIQKIIGIKCCMALPIKLHDKVIGAIFIASKNPDFSKEEIQILELYTNMASIAMGNNFQFQEISKQYEMERETTSILSHEIRTPIAIAHHSSQSILMSLEKYRDSLKKNVLQELTKQAQEIQYGMDRLSRISASIFKLREVENRIPDDIHTIDLKKQLGQIIYLYGKKAHKNKLKFKCHFAKNPKNYKGAIVQLEQIIIILLDNALKYTKQGTVGLQIEFIEQRLVCKVTDTGSGIPLKKRELIFEKFYRHINKKEKQSSQEGLGLGLYIAKKILEKIGGNIEIKDNPEGQGSLFQVDIPVS